MSNLPNPLLDIMHIQASQLIFQLIFSVLQNITYFHLNFIFQYFHPSLN
jgi:hypothetical protein